MSRITRTQARDRLRDVLAEDPPTSAYYFEFEFATEDAVARLRHDAPLCLLGRAFPDELYPLLTQDPDAAQRRNTTRIDFVPGIDNVFDPDALQLLRQVQYANDGRADPAEIQARLG